MALRLTFRTRLAIAFFAVSAGTIGVGVGIAWTKARAAQLEGLRSLLLSEVATVAPEIGDDLAAAKAIGDRVLASNSKFREVYTMSIAGGKGPGWGRFVYDSKTEDEGKDYDMSRFPAMERALAAPSADDDVVADEFGVTISGYAPIRDRAGRTIGILGIDVDGSTVHEMRAALWGLLAGGTLVALLVSGALAWFVASRISRPVAALAAGVDRVGAGDFTSKVDWPGDDEFARLAAQFNTMVEGLEERQRMRQAMHVAMEVQQRLLPAAPPVVPGLDVSGSSDYCDETGGDYFDYPRILTLPGGRVALTVGDVTGHGIGAALLMASGRAVLRTHAEHDTPPARLLGYVNRHLANDATPGKFMTCFFGVLDVAGGTLAYANAGQGGCFVYRRASDSFEDLAASGPPLGVMEDLTFGERRVEGLREGDLVVLGTDGIWEAQDVDGAFFEMERFTDVVRAHASNRSQEIERAVMAAVAAFRRGAPQNDDITLVVARIDGRAARVGVTS